MPTEIEVTDAFEAAATRVTTLRKDAAEAANGLKQMMEDYISGTDQHADDVAELVELHKAGAFKSETQEKKKMATTHDPESVLRVKAPSERYSDQTYAAKHAKTGQPVTNELGREVRTTSERNLAKAGAFLKSIAAKSGLPVELGEHNRELIAECFEDTWCGKIAGEYRSDISGSRAKALIADGTSGGLELVPVFFDEAVITEPLLHSELMPHITVSQVPRGNSVESASIGTPGVTWGIAEGTQASTFDTAGLVTELNTPISRVSCYVEVGRDLMSDSPVNVGMLLVNQIGQKLLSELDRVICIGTGSGQPQGIFNASGLVDIGNPAAGAGGVAAVDDFETLLFSVGKAYRTPQMRCAYVMNDVSYSRARGIEVGASDQRRVFGMDPESYSLFGRPVRICNAIANNLCGFGALAAYRLYRRQGQQVEFLTQDAELARKNLTLLCVRGRYGGKMTQPAGFAFSDNWKS